MILGTALYLSGFLTAALLVCTAADGEHDGHGIGGLIGSLMGNVLMLLLIICAAVLSARHGGRVIYRTGAPRCEKRRQYYETK